MGSTHRGRWAIGPGSTSPSFVLTPAALAPIGLIALAAVALPPIVVVAGREVSCVVAVSCRNPSVLTVPVSTVFHAPVTFTVAPIVWPPICRAVVVAETNEEWYVQQRLTTFAVVKRKINSLD